jgi:hypothetical protein
MQPPRFIPQVIIAELIAEPANHFPQTGSAAHFQPSDPQPNFATFSQFRETKNRAHE